MIRNSTNYRFDDKFKEMSKLYENMVGKRLFWGHLSFVLTRVEKGFAESQFIEAYKDTSFSSYICNEFDLDEKEYAIPVIPVGLDNYETAINDLVNQLCDEKIECDKIKSALNDLKAERDQILIKDQHAKQKIDELNQQIQNIQSQINSL